MMEQSSVGVFTSKNIPAFTTVDTDNEPPVQNETTSQEQIHPSSMALRLLHVGKYNPRTVVNNDQAWSEFLGSIKAQGVLQPILVRSVEGKATPYEIIAGQRRYLASLEVFGPDGKIPVFIREMDDEQAEAAAAAENIDREDMSPVEEAQAAARILGHCKGDRKEAAKRLGWSVTNLNNRLKLMACSEKTRAAVIAKKIPLGIAELLSGLKTDKQDELIETFEKNGVPAASEAQAMIMALSKQLSAAIFDQTECAQCPHNSAQQRSMFGNIEEGHCLNASCYDQKTETRLQARCEELKETFQRIQIVRPGDNFLVVPLKAENVGEQQAQACRSCADFGAAVSAFPDKMGRVSGNLCFGTECHGQKAKAYQDSLKKVQEEAQEPPAEEESSEATETVAEAPKPKPVGSAPKPEGQNPKDATVTLTNAVLEFRDKLYRGGLVKTLRADRDASMQFLLGLLLAKKGSYINEEQIGSVMKAFSVPLSDEKRVGFKSCMKAALEVPTDKLEQALPYFSMASVESLTRDELTTAVKQLNVPLAKIFALNTDIGREFLAALTKVQIEAVCIELGIDKAFNETFKSIIGGKKDECIKRVTNIEGFQYAGKLPKMLLPNATNAS